MTTSDVFDIDRQNKLTDLVKEFTNMYDNKVNKKDYIIDLINAFDQEIEDISISKVYSKNLLRHGVTAAPPYNYSISHVIVFNKTLCIDVRLKNLYEMKGIYLKDREKLTYMTIPYEKTWNILQAKYSELLYRLEDAIDAPISDIIKIG